MKIPYDPRVDALTVVFKEQSEVIVSEDGKPGAIPERDSDCILEASRGGETYGRAGGAERRGGGRIRPFRGLGNGSGGLPVWCGPAATDLG